MELSDQKDVSQGSGTSVRAASVASSCVVLNTHASQLRLFFPVGRAVHAYSVAAKYLPLLPFTMVTLGSEFGTKTPPRFLRAAPKDFFTDVDSEAYLILPKNLAAYNLYSANDFFAGLLVFLPSVIASLVLEKGTERDWPADMSRIMVLAQIAWLVIFITSWPQGWIRHLAKSRAQLLNYINLIRLGSNLEAELPESLLNRQVFAVNLLLARKLQRCEKLAVFLWGVAIAASLALMKWEGKSQDPLLGLKLAVRDANVVLFAIWQGLKLVIQASMVLQKSTEFSLESHVSGGSVTDANLAYYVKLFCAQPSNLDHATVHRSGDIYEKQTLPDGKSRSSVKLLDSKSSRVKDFGSSVSTLDDSLQFSNSRLDQKPVESQDLSVSMVPFPLVCSPCESSETRKVSANLLSANFSSQEKPKRIKTRGLQEARPVAVFPSGTGAFVSPYDTHFSFDETSMQRNSADFSARAFTAKKPSRKCGPHNTPQSFRSKVQYPKQNIIPHKGMPFTPVLLEETKNEALEDLNKKVEAEKNKLYALCWDVWMRALNFDIHNGFPGVVYHQIYMPCKSVTKMAIAVFVTIPLNVTWVVLCLLLFIPRVLFKIFVITPMVMIRDYRKNYNSSTYQEYREVHNVPVFTESASTIIANMLLRRIAGNKSKEYADTVHARKS